MSKETSPRELWLLIKNIAESNVINISNRCSRGASLMNGISRNSPIFHLY